MIENVFFLNFSTNGEGSGGFLTLPVVINCLPEPSIQAIESAYGIFEGFKLFIMYALQASVFFLADKALLDFLKNRELAR